MNEATAILTSELRYFGEPVTVACDTRCDKAWGINSRPKVQLSADDDDYAFLADDELAAAPSDPGTYEGGHPKPLGVPGVHNKWCVRECERHVMVDRGEAFTLPDFSQRVFNLVRTLPIVAPPNDPPSP